jgi:serine/threonine-protein kinase RsbW
MKIESRLELVSLVAVPVRALALEHGLPAADADGLELAVAEAVNNVIIHSYGGKTGYEINVCYRLQAGSIEIDVVDQGSAMSAEQFAALPRNFPDDPDDMIALDEGGRGMPLLFQLLDSVELIQHHKSNVLRLTKRFPQSG